MSAILFGSIGTIVETSELQRRAFNEAFDDHNLDWHWNRDEYCELILSSGGLKRIEEYAEQRGEKVNAQAVHLSKSIRFQQALRDSQLEPRQGVNEVIAGAKENGFKLGFVTTTLPANVEALFHSVSQHIDKSDFDMIVDNSNISQPKPAGDAYNFALQQMQEEKSSSVAIEDNVDGVAAARSEGLHCFAFPGANTLQHNYERANEVVASLDFDSLLHQLSETAV